MKTTLITGGAGFIGSHLADFLIKKGHEVICLDNIFTGKKENVTHLMNNSNFEFIRKDVTEQIHLEVDEIYNLACPASPKYYQLNPVKTIRTNVLGVSNMLELAKELRCKILQVSTSEIYGNPQEHPQKETYWGNVNPIGPRSCYDEGKRVAETIMMDYHRQYKTQIKIARVFNTYGPRMSEHDGRVVSNFIVQSLLDKDLTIFGNGSQTRSFQYISDLVSGLYKLMNKENFIGPVNLGNPNNEISILDLAKKIIGLSKSKSKISFKNLPTDDPTRRNPDISLAKKELQWSPKISLDEGLKETIKYFKMRLDTR